MSAELIGIFLYVAMQFGIGCYLYKKISSSSDYFLAGRSLGPVLATFSIFATWFGAETCIGSSGAIFSEGLAGGRADPFGYTLCLLLMGLFFATRLWKRDLVTLGDLYRKRFSPSVEKFGVLLLIPTSIVWAAAQIRAFGQVLSASSGMSVTLAISIAAALVILYTALGGLLADTITDLVQGIAMMIGIVILFVVTSSEFGGVGPLLQAIEPERLSLIPKGMGLWERLDSWAIPIFGSLVAQELISRVLASRSANIARNSTILAATVYLLIGAMPVVLGLIGPTLFPDLQDPEQLLPMLAKTRLPTILYIMFAGALVSAILSTVDSTLLAAGSLFSNNILFSYYSHLEEKEKVKWGRLAVAFSGLIAYALAVFGGSIYELVELSSSFGGGGLFVITVFGLFTSVGGYRHALAALIVSCLSVPLASLWQVPAPYLFSMLCSGVAYLAMELAPADQYVLARAKVRHWITLLLP